ncbi:hypothetical protein GCM10023329_24820 [Streptomyces sanyensis]|uniref:Uncharacterized protein n=1 Tax=Streptomyces sanyensis TaxID=568869 RepID=A0ABP9A7Q3_9ACTN
MATAFVVLRVGAPWTGPDACRVGARPTWARRSGGARAARLPGQRCAAFVRRRGSEAERETATGVRDGVRCMDVERAGAVRQVTFAVWGCFAREEASAHYQTKTHPGAHTRAVSLSCVRVGTRTGKDLIK